MKEFKSFKSFATHLALMAVEAPEVSHHIVKKSAEGIAEVAKSLIGTYQDTVGPFPAWAALADSTEEEKARLGYPASAPLLRTGMLRDSIESQSVGSMAVVGTDDPVMIYHEFGTSKMPARPVLGPAAIHSRHGIEAIIKKTSVAWLMGLGWRRPSTPE